MDEKQQLFYLTRREFISATGKVVVFASVAGLAACVSCAPKDANETSTGTAELIKAGVIEHDPALCTGCGVCYMMCSLTHENLVSPLTSRIQMERNPFEGEFVFNSCQQCQSPACYFACPLKDIALCIDQTTGVKYVNVDKCTGCGKCYQACIYDPARVRNNPINKKAIKCDLCKDRDGGPVCVQYCTVRALRLVPAEGRV